MPPGRYSVVERGGRLVVIDRDTGQTPLSAAERMADHDRRMGHEPNRPVEREKVPAPTPTAATPASRSMEAPPANDRMAAAVAGMNRKQPWKTTAAPKPSSAAKPEPARIAQRQQPSAGAPARGRKTVVTGKWWDSKGPRTIELGPKGQQTLSGGFITLFFVALIAAIVTLFIAPILFFIVAFLLFRFGGQVLGPIGAGIVDKALAERN